MTVFSFLTSVTNCEWQAATRKWFAYLYSNNWVLHARKA